MGEVYLVSSKTKQSTLIDVIRYIGDTKSYDGIKFTIRKYRERMEQFINTGIANREFLSNNTVAKAVNFLDPKIKYSLSVIMNTALFSCERFILSEVIFPKEELEKVDYVAGLLADNIYSLQYSKIKNKECLELIKKSIAENEIYYPIFGTEIEIEKMLYNKLSIDARFIDKTKRLFSLMTFIFDNLGIDAVFFACDCFGSYDVLGNRLLQSPELRPYLIALDHPFTMTKSHADLKPENIKNFVESNPDHINLIPLKMITPELIDIYLNEAKEGTVVTDRVAHLIPSERIEKSTNIFRVGYVPINYEKSKSISIYNLDRLILNDIIDHYGEKLINCKKESIKFRFNKIICDYLYSKDKYGSFKNFVKIQSNKGLLI